MLKKCAGFLLVICCSPLLKAAAAGDSSAADTSRINYWRFGAVSVAAASTLGASYVHLQNTWWKETARTFHFDDGKDLKYAVNLDKFGHFYGGMISSDLYHRALRWSRFPLEKAYWYGAGFGIFVQLAIEVKDGFAPRWGFSWWDIGTGALGSLYPVGKHYSGALNATDFKMSYFRRSDKYFDTVNPNARKNAWNDDYINQTYWISFKPNGYLGESAERWWPDFLAVAAGFGVDEEVDGNGAGNFELYLALDYDLVALFPEERKFWRTVAHFVNYFKFPAPAIRLSPTHIGYGAFF